MNTADNRSFKDEQAHETPLSPRVPVKPGTNLKDIRQATDAVISPDGKWAAFVVWEWVPDKPKQRGRIWIIETAGGEARPFTSGPKADTCPRWSPDSRQIVFDSVKDGRSVIYTVNSDGGIPRLFVSDQWDNMMPSWSSNGRFIYFASRREGNILRVWKKPVDGGAAVGGERGEIVDEAQSSITLMA